MSNKPKTFLDCYYEWIGVEKMPFWGLCKSLPRELKETEAFQLIYPTKEEKEDNMFDGGGHNYWGNENYDLYENWDFTPQRQSILLMCAALNGEFDKPKKKKK